jgi:hypothetical protein
MVPACTLQHCALPVFLGSTSALLGKRTGNKLSKFDEQKQNQPKKITASDGF